MAKWISRVLFIAVILFCIGNIYYIRVISQQEQSEIVGSFIEKNLTIDKPEEDNNSSTFSITEAMLNPFGALFAPSIDLKIALYDGYGEKEISKGAGVITPTGDLSGNNGMNTIITSHNGDSFQDLFMNLEKIKTEDTFYIMNNEGTILEYNVIEIKTAPADDEMSYIKEPENNKNFVTLRTCTPIGINSHRLLVIGELKGTLNDIAEIPKSELTFSTYQIALIAIGGVALLLMLYRERSCEKDKR